MGKNLAGSLHSIRASGNKSVVFFLHGFSRSRDDTWGHFPIILGTAISNRDIFTLGYATRFHPDIVGIWSAETHDALTLAAEMRSPAAAEMVAQEDHTTQRRGDRRQRPGTGT